MGYTISSILTREAEGDYTHRKEGNVKLQAKLGVILSQVKECSSHQKLEGKAWIFPIEPPEEVQPTQHLDLAQ